MLFLCNFLRKGSEKVTTLKVTLNDQKLIAEEKLVIASGDINSVYIDVTFDESWSNYPHRYATFETTAMNGEPIEVVLDSGKAVVPSEVVANPGVLLVGVWATTLDGEEAKTSTYAKYKISQGARQSSITIKPTMNLYQQFLSALNDKFSPMAEAFQMQLNEFVSNYKATLEDAANMLMNRNGIAKVTVDTYEGNGNAENNPHNIISCDKKPAMVIINCPSSSNDGKNSTIVLHCNGTEIENGESVFPAYEGSGLYAGSENKELNVVVRQTSNDTWEIEWYHIGASSRELNAKYQGNKDGVTYTYTIISC